MYLELFLAASLMAVGSMVFGRFEEHKPIWGRLLKLGIFLVITAVLSLWPGRIWALTWVFGLAALGMSVHVLWCRKHKINWLTAEPRTRYYAFLGIKSEPLMPASYFCGAIGAWAGLCMNPTGSEDEYKKKWSDDFRKHWQFIYTAIMKSCLLDRLIYGGETVRARMCPAHNGHWSGCWLNPSQKCECAHGSCLTGWLPNEDDPVSQSTVTVRMVSEEDEGEINEIMAELKVKERNRIQ